MPILEHKRTEHMIKNRYNSLINKNRLSKREKEEVVANKILNELEISLNLKHKTKVFK